MAQDFDKLFQLGMQLKRTMFLSFQQNGSFEEKASTILQFHVLSLLDIQEGVTLSEIATFTCTSKSSTTQLINRLDKAGFVTRKPGTKDRRTMHHFLTKEGMANLQQMKERQQNEMKKMFAGLDEKDITTLTVIMEKLLHTLKEQ